MTSARRKPSQAAYTMQEFQRDFLPGRSYSSIRLAVWRGTIPSVMVGNRPMIPADYVEAIRAGEDVLRFHGRKTSAADAHAVEPTVKSRPRPQAEP